MEKDINRIIYNSHIKAIKDALDEGRLAIFIGSGVSRSENPEYPLWADICSDLLEDLCGLNESDSLKIAQRYELEFTREKLLHILRGYFNKNGKTGLLEKILKLHPHCVVTTNWDNLLNQAVENTASYWNVIANDAELVGLHNEQKVIKMHGDFEHNNVVFTENDYLNYSNNFPLIEAFVKSLLATHVVLFIGYSFNDPDLKQILNWINRQSVDLPAKYFVDYQKNDEEPYALKNWEKYLDSWKMIVLPLSGNSLSIFFDNISGYSKSLLQIKNCTELFHNICKPFENIDVILYSSFENYILDSPFHTDILYTQKGFKLVFYASSKDENINDYKDFFSTINQYLSDEKNLIDKKLNYIISNLSKLGVEGIALNTSFGWKNDIEVWFENIQEDEENFISFENSLLIKPRDDEDTKKYLRFIYDCIQVGDYIEAKKYCDKAIKLCGVTKDIRSLFICYFNLNHILKYLGLLLPDHDNFSKYMEQKINIMQEFMQYPAYIRNQLEELNRFISFEEIYNQAIRFRELREKVENAYDKATGQQIAYFSNLGKYMYTFSNLLHFIYSNALCIEKYNEFKLIARDYFSLSFFISTRGEKSQISLSRIDLYVAIKYMKSDELVRVLAEQKSEKWKIKLTDDCCEWLIWDALEHCLYNAHNYRYRANEYLFEYIQNILILLARIELKDNQRKEIMEMIIDFIKETNVPINLIQYLSYFLSVRYNNFGSDLEKSAIEKLLNTFINKVIYMKVSFAELHALVTNSFTNCYGYLQVSGEKYSGIGEIKKLMTSLDLYCSEDKTDLLKNMVLYLYLISDENCKKQIKEYIDNENYFSIASLNKDISEYALCKLIICILTYHIEGIKDLSEQDKSFIVSDLKKRNIKDKNDVVLSYFSSLKNIEESQKTERVKEIISLYEGINKSEQE